MSQSYFQYIRIGIGPHLSKLLTRKRQQMVDQFIKHLNPLPSDTILDVGVSPDEDESSNMLLKVLSNHHRITALGLADHSELEQLYPGLRFVQGDGRQA